MDKTEANGYWASRVVKDYTGTEQEGRKGEAKGRFINIKGLAGVAKG